MIRAPDHDSYDPGDPHTMYAWDSKGAYTANSSSPGQDANYRRLRELMDADPEWHDGEIVFSRP